MLHKQATASWNDYMILIVHQTQKSVYWTKIIKNV